MQYGYYERTSILRACLDAEEKAKVPVRDF